MTDKQFLINKALGPKRVAEKKKDTAYNTRAHSKALKKAMYTSPTGSKHKIGSAKHKYWQDIEKRGREDKKYGAGD